MAGVPLVVALGGMVAPIAIYLAINAGRSSASGWGTAMSTDTAFALPSSGRHGATAATETGELARPCRGHRHRPR